MNTRYKGQRPRQTHTVLAESEIGKNRDLLIVVKPRLKPDDPLMLALVQRVRIDTDINMMPQHREILTISPQGLLDFFSRVDTEDMDVTLMSLISGVEVKGISTYES